MGWVIGIALLFMWLQQPGARDVASLALMLFLWGIFAALLGWLLSGRWR